MSKEFFRHGDLVFIALTDEQKDRLANNAKMKSHDKAHDSAVLALGETTGHRHVLTMKKPASLKIYKIDQTIDLTKEGIRTSTGHVSDTDVIVVLESDGVMTHEEHGDLDLPKGSYLKRIKNEFDPFEDQWKEVID